MDNNKLCISLKKDGKIQNVFIDKSIVIETAPNGELGIEKIKELVASPKRKVESIKQPILFTEEATKRMTSHIERPGMVESIKSVNGGLEIRSPKGSIFSTKENGHTIVPLGKTREYNSMTCKVSSNAMRHGQQAGIFYYRDNKNYTKLVFEHMGEQRQMCAVVVWENNDKPKVISVTKMPKTSCTLRMTQEGGKLIASYFDQKERRFKVLSEIPVGASLKENSCWALAAFGAGEFEAGVRDVYLSKDFSKGK